MIKWLTYKYLQWRENTKFLFSLQMKRTPLHYAMALSEEITALLTSNGADSEALDMVRTMYSKIQNPK